jgi:hypothetical protein
MKDCRAAPKRDEERFLVCANMLRPKALNTFSLNQLNFLRLGLLELCALAVAKHFSAD